MKSGSGRAVGASAQGLPPSLPRGRASSTQIVLPTPPSLRCSVRPLMPRPSGKLLRTVRRINASKSGATSTPCTPVTRHSGATSRPFTPPPFVGEPGTASLQTGLQLVTQLDTGVRHTLPPEAPTDFVPTAWWPALRQPDGTFERRTWELALALGVRDALRAGSLYLPASRRHVSFWKLVYDDAQWAQEQPQAYVELAMPRAVAQALGDLRQTFDTVAQQAVTGLPANPFVRIQNNRLRPKRDDALEIPPRVKELRRVIETHLPRIRIEELLMTVDRWCGFTRAFTSLSDAPPRRPLPSPAPVARASGSAHCP